MSLGLGGSWVVLSGIISPLMSIGHSYSHPTCKPTYNFSLFMKLQAWHKLHELASPLAQRGLRASRNHVEPRRAMQKSCGEHSQSKSAMIDRPYPEPTTLNP